MVIRKMALKDGILSSRKRMPRDRSLAHQEVKSHVPERTQPFSSSSASAPTCECCQILLTRPLIPAYRDCRVGGHIVMSAVFQRLNSPSVSRRRDPSCDAGFDRAMSTTPATPATRRPKSCGTASRNAACPPTNDHRTGTTNGLRG